MYINIIYLYLYPPWDLRILVLNIKIYLSSGWTAVSQRTCPDFRHLKHLKPGHRGRRESPPRLGPNIFFKVQFCNKTFDCKLKQTLQAQKWK